MAEFPTQARVVIIGGGVVGASSLYHLAKAGWTDCVLLEKNELTLSYYFSTTYVYPSLFESYPSLNLLLDVQTLLVR